MKLDKKKIFIAVVFITIVLMLIQIEIVIHRNYAPESLLIRVNAPKGLPQENATCKADIVSNQINVNDKSLKGLNSIYDFVDANTWSYKNGDKGFYLLETNFSNYQGEFEIKIVCYSPGYSGVSYTVINNTNMPCELRDNGKFLVC